MSLTIEKYGIYRVELPAQDVTRKGENGKPIPVTGSELHGPHRVVVVSVAEDQQSAVVIPLTSAQDDLGGERRRDGGKKTWLRVYHKKKPAYILCEQIRYADRGRFYAFEDWLGEYDQKQLDLKLKILLGLT
jgi:mRNA-degrading endonuclease toxin of MazEF toxin-antitoxin module